MTDASAALNALTDELNDALSDAEDAIQALQLGVIARIPIDLGPDSVYGELEWSRINGAGQWGLHLIGKDPKTEKRWVPKASRAARIAVAYVLPDLLAALRTKVDGQVPQAREAVERVRAFTESIRNTLSAFPPNTRRCRLCGNAEQTCHKPCRQAGDGLHIIEPVQE